MNTEQPRSTARPARPGVRVYLVLLAVGLLLSGTAVFLWHHNVPAPTDAGSMPVVVTSTVTVPPTATDASIPEPTSSATSGSASPHSSDGAAAMPSQGRSPRTIPVTPTSSRSRQPPRPSSAGLPAATGSPAVLELPTLGVSAHVDPVESSKGVLQVPDDISRVGWWQHGVLPGSPTGSTVIDGHIDSAAAGEGALFHLADLSPGDRVIVTTNAGRTINYEVQARRVYVKEQGLPADLFDQQGQARLVIISCGGPFDSSIHSYEDNIAIFATPTA